MPIIWNEGVLWTVMSLGLDSESLSEHGCTLGLFFDADATVLVQDLLGGLWTVASFGPYSEHGVLGWV